MARELETRETLRLPLYSTEKEYYAASTGSAWHWRDQLLVNCFPVINKDPLRREEGEITILSRPGVRDPVQGNTDLGSTCLTNLSTTLGVEPLAVLGITGLAAAPIIVAYFGYDTVAAQYQLRIVAYIPDVSSTLVGTINLTSYGYSAAPAVHLTQITNGAGLVGIAVAFHPEAYISSTSSNSDVYYAITTSGAFTASSLAAIADVDFPTNTPAKGIVGGLQQLNNVHYIMTMDGYIYGSYPSTTFPFNPDITSWNAQGNTTTSQNPDGGAGLVRYKHHLLAFGQNSCEFFNDEGLAQPNLPIRRTQQAFFNIGLLNANSYINIDDDLYFLGTSGKTNHIGLYKLSGYTPTLVSSAQLSTAFLNRAQYNARLQTVSLNGTRHLITNIWHEANPDWNTAISAEAPANTGLKGVLVYALDSNAWWIWAVDPQDDSYWVGPIRIFVAQTKNTSFGNQWIWLTINGAPNSRPNFSCHPMQMFSYQTISQTDSYDSFREGVTTGPVVNHNFTIPILIVTNRFDFGSSNRKTINRVRLLMDRPKNRTSISDPLLSFNTAGHTLQMFCLKDDAADNTEISSTGLEARWDIKTLIDNPTMNWNNLGTMRKAKFVIQVNTWIPFRFEGLEVTLTRGAH